MPLIYIGIGTNIGNRELQIAEALEHLGAVFQDTNIRISPLYETAPEGPLEQPDYLNAVVELSSQRQPQHILCLLQKIEENMGRERSIRWGPRTIDLDILLVGTLQINEHNLVVPHSRLAQRRFVLQPLADLNPNIIIPGTGMPALELLNQCTDAFFVRPYSSEIADSDKPRETAAEGTW